MKKLLYVFNRPIRFCFQPEYRKKRQLRKGHRVWLSLNKNLPQATGNPFDDEPRLEKFKLRISFITTLDQQALKKWLEHQLEKLQKNAAEDVSYLIEKEEEKMRKIYQEHLDLIPR